MNTRSRKRYFRELRTQILSHIQHLPQELRFLTSEWEKIGDLTAYMAKEINISTDGMYSKYYKHPNSGKRHCQANRIAHRNNVRRSGLWASLIIIPHNPLFTLYYTVWWCYWVWLGVECVGLLVRVDLCESSIWVKTEYFWSRGHFRWYDWVVSWICGFFVMGLRWVVYFCGWFVELRLVYII